MKDKPPLVSVIMASYNAARWIKDAIQSVRSQTLKDWELIVVDDASTDGSVDIVQSFAKLDPRIKVVALEKNSGTASVPRNVGLSLAEGKYICFLDADDIYHPKRLELAASIFGQYPDVNIVINDFIRFSKNIYEPIGPPHFEHILRVWPSGEYWNKKASKIWIADYEAFRLSVVYACPAHTSSITIDSEFIGDKKPRFNENMSIYEDIDLWLRIMQEAKTAFIPRTLSYYRQHKFGLSGDDIAFSFANVKIHRIKIHLYWHLLCHNDRATMKENLAKALFSLGWNLYRSGDGHKSRKYYLESFYIRKDIRTLIAIMKTFVPYELALKIARKRLE